MGCNTSQEPATSSVENDNAAKPGADNVEAAEADVKNESVNEILKGSSNEIPMVNGDPLGKDEGELVVYIQIYYFYDSIFFYNTEL